MDYDNNRLRAVPVRSQGAGPAPNVIDGGYAGDSSKVLRNTYMLLSATLLFSAVMAGVSLAIGAPRGAGTIATLGALLLVWLVLPRTANSEKGIYTVFAITGLIGFGLGPMLNFYLRAIPNGGQLVLTALGGTALIFGALSTYVLTTRKDFSFMGGFLMAGLMVVVLVSLGGVVASLFGMQVTMLFLAINAASMLLFSGLILFDTSRIIHGGETNYILATISLYLDILNLFTSLLQILGYANRR